jgi:hypothetical protein
MTRQLEKTWAGNVLSASELKEYANFERDLPTRFSESEQKKCEQEWFDLVREIDANLDKDPDNELGIMLGKRCMDWVNNLYGKEYITLRNAIWEKGFKGGYVAEEHGLSPASVAWLDKAIDAYHKGRIYKILDQIDSHSSGDALKSWEDLLSDMCGNDQGLRSDLINAAMLDDKVSQAAKDWLEKVTK